MSPNNQEPTTTPGAGPSAGSGNPSTSCESETVIEDWIDFFDFDAYERDINHHSERSTPAPGTAIPSNTSSSVEPPSAPSFSLPTITEHEPAPATLVAARDKDVEFEVNSLDGQEQESDEDMEMGEDAQISDDAEMEDVASAADVLAAAGSRTDTLSPFEPTPVDSPGDVPTLSPINEQDGHDCRDAQRERGDEPRTSAAEPPERGHGTSTPQTKTSSGVVSGSFESDCTSCPRELKGPEREAVAEEPSKETTEPKWEVHRILTSAILSDGLLYYRVSWKGWGKPDHGMYPAHNFRESPDRLISFHRRHPKKPGPPLRLDIWKKAFDNDEEIGKHEDDDLPVEAKKRIKRRLRGNMKRKAIARR